MPWRRAIRVRSHADPSPSSAPPLCTPPGSIPGWRRELYDNSLDGTLPPEYSTMTKMTYLCVAYARGRA